MTNENIQEHTTCDAEQSTIQNCELQNNKTWDVHECECVCGTENVCSGNFILNNTTCGCECPVGSSAPCQGGQVVVAENCECGCANSEQTCSDGATFNTETCECECPSCTNVNYVHSEGSCACECPVGSSGDCPGNQVLLQDNCECGCIELENNTNICHGDGQTWNEETCECDCNENSVCTGQSMSTKMVLGECKCVCDAESLNCESPLEPNDNEAHGCICECNQQQKNNCINDELDTTYWNEETCSCDAHFYLTSLLPTGSTEVSSPNPRDFENASDVEFWEGGEMREQIQIESVAMNETQQNSKILNTSNGLIKFTGQTTMDHPIGTEVRPKITIQPTTTETPCVGAGCDPHISTFFNEKFEM